MHLDSALSRVRRLQRFGRCLAACLAASCVLAICTLIAGLLDAWLAFESSSRSTLVIAFLAIFCIIFLSLLIRSIRFSKIQAAAAADATLRSPRNPASAALSLPTQETPLAELLANRTREAASKEILALPATRLIPWKSARTAIIALLCTCAPIATLCLLFPDASLTISKRLLNPNSDIAPWSLYRFEIIPAKPVAVYGGELPLSVEISGKTPDLLPIEFLVRRPNSSTVERLPTFRESNTRFSRTLDSVTEPVSIAFAIGKARSEWMQVELLLQPKVLAGETTITPPSYTKREAFTSSLDSNEIIALEGSELVLTLSSNRPLAPSDLIFTPATLPGIEPSPEPIPGTVHNANTISFRWIATRSGSLSATLRDVRGTPAASALELNLKAVPDQAPLVDIASPPRLLLATPSSTLTIQGRAEDDFSLSKVRLVRTLEGFRDRTHTIAPALNEKDFNFEDNIPLDLLGVTPGQVIELFLEAADHNPSLLGQGSSEISRVQIITEEEYAYRLRAKTTLEEFNTRYRAIAQAMREAMEGLEKMREDAKANPAKPEDIQKAREAAKNSHEKAAELLKQLAQDFPAFEMEKRLKELARNAEGAARDNLNQLDKFDPNAPPEEQQKEIEEMLERLGAQEQQQQELQKDAELMAEAGKILEMAAKFQQIYQTQVSITKRIFSIAREIHEGNDNNRRMLGLLADTQQKNREALDEFAAELKKRIDASQHPDLADMVQSANDFLDALKAANPQSVMDLSSKSGRLGNAEDAYVQAELARSLLEKLMEKPEPFPQACQGQAKNFNNNPRPDINETMQQLLEGLMAQNPGMSQNQGMGEGGMGGGGTGPTGNAAPGFGLGDLPVLGPQRLQFDPQSLGGSGDGTGKSGKNGNLQQAAENSRLKPTETPKDTRTAPDPQSIPESYRDAVKQYFTP